MIKIHKNLGIYFLQVEKIITEIIVYICIKIFLFKYVVYALKESINQKICYCKSILCDNYNNSVCTSSPCIF